MAAGDSKAKNASTENQTETTEAQTITAEPVTSGDWSPASDAQVAAWHAGQPEEGLKYRFVNQSGATVLMVKQKG